MEILNITPVSDRYVYTNTLVCDNLPKAGFSGSSWIWNGDLYHMPGVYGHEPVIIVTGIYKFNKATLDWTLYDSNVGCVGPIGIYNNTLYGGIKNSNVFAENWFGSYDMLTKTYTSLTPPISGATNYCMIRGKLVTFKRINDIYTAMVYDIATNAFSYHPILNPPNEDSVNSFFVLGKYIYTSNGDRLNPNKIYRTNTEDWSSEFIATAPGGYYGGVVAVVGNRLFTGGGWETPAFIRNPKLWTMSLLTRKWSLVDSNALPAYAGNSIVVDNNMHFIGGSYDGGNYNVSKQYNRYRLK